MMWWIEDIKKSIKDKYWLDFNDERFYFVRPNTKEQWTILLWVIFSHKEFNKNLNFPYKTRLDYQKFLNSWEEKDLPSWLKLEDLILPRK